MSARQALEMGTRGGAAVLGRSDIGSLEEGKAGDFIALDLSQVSYAGALHDPVAALPFCAPRGVAYNVVGGKFVVKEGALVTADVDQLIETHNQLAQQLVQ
jgi:cytosine/adenosine deaminase-related metal-dependent hydrolase